MSLLSQLSEIVAGAFVDAGFDGRFGDVVISQRPELGQFQCNGALPAARRGGRTPREIAEAVAERLAARTEITGVSVADPGFINISVSDGLLAEHVQGVAEDTRLGVSSAESPLHVIVDYAGPNVAKAMHVGHLRATLIGDSLARLFRYAGHRVTRDPHFGDWGLQMGLVIAGIEERRPDLPYFDPNLSGPYPDDSPVTLDDLQVIYPEVAERAVLDEDFAERARRATLELQRGRPGYLALWRHMKKVSEESQRRDFSRLGVEFDLWYGESDVSDRIKPMIERLAGESHARPSEGALVIDIAEPNDRREWPPFILEKTGGGFLYTTTDLATVEMRVKDLGADLILYVVDRRQSDHLESVFRAARRTGIAPHHVDLEHIAFGTMNDKDGRPFKTRAGGVVRLSDMIELVVAAAERRLDEAEIARGYPEEERRQIATVVGIGALKFGDLANHRSSDYVFDLDRFIAFDGKTGPYLQYGAVRIRSILRNAAALEVRGGPTIAPTINVERELMLQLSLLPEVIERAIETRAPNHLAEFAYELAGRWNRFYDTCHILREPERARQASWLTQATTTLRMLTLCLELLGIEVPERM